MKNVMTAFMDDGKIMMILQAGDPISARIHGAVDQG